MKSGIFSSACSHGLAPGVAILMGMIAALALTTIPANADERPAATADARPRSPDHDRREHGRHQPYPGYDYGRAPGVEVYVNPETEHAPSNYVPDNYRLDAYDGRPDRPTLCRGQSGMTLSTTQTPCPAGQSPSSGGRTLSTSP